MVFKKIVLIFGFFLVLLFSGCDKCYLAARKMCDCWPTEEERRRCMKDLLQAEDHVNFDKAQDESVDQKICEEVIKKCTCEDWRSGKRAECGLYR